MVSINKANGYKSHCCNKKETAISFWIIIIIAIPLALLAGLLYWIFILTNLFLNRISKQGPRQPESLFWAAFGFGTGMIFLVLLLAPISPNVFGMLFSLAGMAGAFGLFFQMMASLSGQKENKAYRKEHPLPKRHFWLQDLLISVLSFGTSMSIFAGTAPANLLDTYKILLLALFFLICIMIGSWVASDIFRRSKSLQRPIPRGCYQVCLLLGFILLLPIGYIAWRIWQRALRGFEKPQQD